MAGTKAGGRKTAATNIAKYGCDFYRRIGSKGGQNGHTGGFAANPALARVAGAKGGRISKRSGSGRKEKEYVWRPGDDLFRARFGQLTVEQAIELELNNVAKWTCGHEVTSESEEV